MLFWYTLCFFSRGYNTGEYEHGMVFGHFRCQHMTSGSPVTLSTFSIDTSAFKQVCPVPLEVPQKTGRERLEGPHLVNISLISLNAVNQARTQSTSLSTFSRMNAFTSSSLGHLFDLFGPASRVNSSCPPACLWNSCKPGAW